MTAINYIIEVIISSGIFLALYRWMIARKVGFRLCRIYLMVTMLLSALIPAMNVPVYVESDTFLPDLPYIDRMQIAEPSADELTAEGRD